MWTPEQLTEAFGLLGGLEYDSGYAGMRHLIPFSGFNWELRTYPETASGSIDTTLIDHHAAACLIEHAAIERLASAYPWLAILQDCEDGTPWWAVAQSSDECSIVENGDDFPAALIAALKTILPVPEKRSEQQPNTPRKSHD